MIDIDLLIYGSYYHSMQFSSLEYQKDVYIGVEKGVILFIQPSIPDGFAPRKTIILDKDQFLIPGFIDTHIHAPQYVFTGTGYDKGLLDWLNTYTFPQESKFKNKSFAKNVYDKVVSKTLSNGTTCASYYATIHTDSSILLAEICMNLGQRAFIGKVNMDRNSPDYYIETTQESICETERFIKAVQDLDCDWVTPCITPRFAPSCTELLMKSLGELASKYDLPIQSHLSESINEINWVKELHPDVDLYSLVYAKYGLLNDKTIMAHCIHSDFNERKVLFDHKVGISHCPSSNFCLHSGTLNVRRLYNDGFIKLGLGTDCSGGYSPNMFDAMRQSIIASKVTSINSVGPDQPFKSFGYKEAFYMATLGGARVMNLENKIGRFQVGMEFDALLIDLKGIDIFEHDDEWTSFEKLIYLGDDRNIKKVFVFGKLRVEKQ
jgi:guanine deaminase